VLSALDDKAYAIVDELGRIAKDIDSTPARVALAWVQARPGVTSTIIGARTIAQLDDNIAALDVKLSADQIKALDDLSTPKLDFPASFLKMSGTFIHGGATVNGEPSKPWPLAPRDDSERY
jgi:diketogulonate reductase-like aldo/keto reductase